MIMKKVLALLILSFSLSSVIHAQIKLPRNLGGSKTVTIEQIPSNTDEFIQLRDRLATTPEGGAAIFVLAAIKYTQDPEMGRHWVIIATDPYWLSASSADRAYKGFDLGNSANFSLQQADGKPYIPNSYIKGTSVSNGYQLGNAPYKISIERSADAGDKMVKIFIQTSGADTARPITMNKNDAGVWKGFEYSSIFVGVKQPAVKSRGAAGGDF